MTRFAKLSVAVVLLTSSIGCGGKPDGPKTETTADALPADKVEGTVNVARPEMTFQIRHASNHGDAVVVRLNIDRLRAYDLSQEDVMKAATPSGWTDRQEPPPGVVFNNSALTPDQYANILVKADAEGKLVKLKDVATLELLTGREARQAESHTATNRDIE